MWIGLCLLSDFNVHLLLFAEVWIGKDSVCVLYELRKEGLSFPKHTTLRQLSKVRLCARFGKQTLNDLVTSFLFHAVIMW